MGSEMCIRDSPTLVPTRRCPVDVELRGALTYGMTVADMRAIAEDSCTSRVGIGLETDRFWDLVAGALARLD